MTRQRKNNQTRRRRVAGEDVDVLLPLLTRFAHSLVQNVSGTFSGHVTYGSEEAPPLVRALMRVEAELLLDDARQLAGPENVWRTPENRRADALVLLVLRTAVAAGSAVDPELLERYRSSRHAPTPRGVSWCA